MTLIASVSLNGKQVFLMGDSVVTFVGSIPATPDKTSQFEDIQPLMQGDVVYGYAEVACKIGKVGHNLGVAICGAAELALTFLDTAFPSLTEAWTERDLINQMNTAAKSLEGHTHEEKESASLHFALSSKEDGLVQIMVKLLRCPPGTFSIEYASNRPLVGSGSWRIDGSGAKIIGSYFPQDIMEATAADPTLAQIGDSLLSLDYSVNLKKATTSQAIGVGGAFLGLMVDTDGIRYQVETLYIHIDQFDTMQIGCKIKEHNGHFYVTNFIDQHVTVLRTIETSIRLRRHETFENNDDLRKFAQDSLSLQAQVILIKHHVKDIDKPVISIVQGQPLAISSATLQGFHDGTPIRFYKGSEFTFKNENYEIHCRVRSS